jgi:hypothetical protein
MAIVEEAIIREVWLIGESVIANNLSEVIDAEGFGACAAGVVEDCSAATRLLDKGARRVTAKRFKITDDLA